MPTDAHRADRDRLAAALAAAIAEGDALPLPGSITARRGRCGTLTCGCHTDPDRRHGPYLQWTRKVAGKTVTRTLTAQQAARYQAWIDHARRLRGLLHDLEALGVAAAEHDEGWNHAHNRSSPDPD